MKNDYFFHSYMKQFEILKIVTLDNTETNKAFHGHKLLLAYFYFKKKTRVLRLYSIIIYTKLHSSIIKSFTFKVCWHY